VLGDPAIAVAMLGRDGDPTALLLQAHSSRDGAGSIPQSWPLDGSLGSVVLEQNRTAYISDLTQVEETAAPFDRSSAVRSLLATPVRFAGAPAGVLVACSKTAAHWTEEQFRVMEWVAAQCGLMIDAWRSRQALERRAGEIEAANRAKDNFLAALSHELRMPLTPVLMTASALCVDERLPEDLRDQLRIIERNVGLEARLIDDLLDLSRITKGKLKMRQQLCDAYSLIAFAVDIVRGDVRDKGITLERELTAEHSGLVADPSRFQQVIWNLLRNAVKFTPAGGRITIRTSEEISADDPNPRLRIEIADSGVGIDAAALKQIFEPFQQGTPGHDYRFGGLGLGLAIARAIVRLHGGTIRAESGGLNQGSTFVVELPGATAPPSGMSDTSGVQDRRASARERNTGCIGPAPLRLLVVEDHEATLQVLTRLLMRAGHKVTAVSSVSAALAEAAAQPFDGVVSDLGLPDGTGKELMEKLHTTYGLRGIALTGYGMEEDIEQSRKAGFLAHLIKPVDFAQLSEALLRFGIPTSHDSNGTAAGSSAYAAADRPITDPSFA
jgi:signal transduction histidine kinase/CheY-like chemotaxis protein